jgi:hypothetical protein
MMPRPSAPRRWDLNKEEYYQTLCELADEIGECQGC